MAMDQFGVVNIFTREEQVVTISSFPEWGEYYKVLPGGVVDAEKVLVRRNFK